jgi:hypothetical protein
MSTFLYIGVTVSVEEKSVWIQGLLAPITFVAYVVIVLTRAGGSPLAEVDYAPIMLGAIAVSIVVAIILNITIGMFSSKRDREKDQRDHEIYRFGEHMGSGLLVVGAVAALILALFEIDHFWIANALYLGFTLSAVTAAIAKIVSYRSGLPW